MSLEGVLALYLVTGHTLLRQLVDVGPDSVAQGVDPVLGLSLKHLQRTLL